MNNVQSFIFKIRHAWGKGQFLERCRRALIVRWNALIYRLSPVLLAKICYYRARGRWPDLTNPRTFDEKLLWLMLYWRDPLKTSCADKYELRSYASELNLSHLLPPLLAVYERSDEIDFDTLPDAFVLKATHGSGMNIFCRDKSRLDTDATRRKADIWLHTDYGTKHGELHYSDMKPRIIVEPLLTQEDGRIPADYKLYCYRGRVHCALACTERDPTSDLSSGVKFDFYNYDWSEKLVYSRSSLQANRQIPKPAAYEEMVAAAEILSRPFPFVRVDFYSVKGRAVLGELTFTPEGCIDTGYTELGQHALGELVELPPKTLS